MTTTKDNLGRLIIKPTTPGRITTAINNDGTVDIVSDPTIQELTDTIKFLATKWVPSKIDNLTIPYVKVFPKDGKACEIYSHRTNRLNKALRIFCIYDNEYAKNQFMVLVPLPDGLSGDSKSGDIKEFLFEPSDGTWSIISDHTMKLQVMKRNGELIAATIVKENNGTISVQFFQAHHILFQDGPIKDGVIGISNEALMAIMIERFRPDGGDNNNISDSLQTARLWMHKRTLDRSTTEGMS